MMPTRNSGSQVNNSTIRTRVSRLLFSAITCAALLRATGSAEAGRARFQLRLSPKHRESQCLRLHEESKPVGGDLPVHIRDGGPLGGPCRLEEFICEEKDGEGLQFSVTNTMRAANEGNSDSVVLHLNGVATQIRTVASAEAKQMCRGARSFRGAPVVFVQRDNPNIFHLFERELLPLFISLQQYHMQHFKFQVIFTREWQPEGKPEHLRQNQTRLLDMYERISGGLKPLSLSSLKERIVCGHTGVIGLDTGRLYKFGADHREEYTDKHPESRDIFRGFLQWFLAAYGLIKPETLQDKQVPTVLIVVRGEDEWRRIRGTEHFEAYASSQGWHVERLNCRVASLEEQLMTLLRASLLVTVHGAAMAMAAFLPPRAVAVEMMPFGFTKEFYHGYANWLDMATVSHVVWHEQEQMQHIGEVGVDVAGVSQPCGKNSDVFVTEASAADMLQTAHLVWKTPLGRREQTTYLNRPAVHQCNGK